MTRMRRFAALVVIALGLGCASSGVSRTTKNQNVITEEIAQTTATDAYELIQHLRPNYLRTRGAVHGAPSADGNHLETVHLVIYVNDPIWRNGSVASDRILGKSRSSLLRCVGSDDQVGYR